MHWWSVLWLQSTNFSFSAYVVCACCPIPARSLRLLSCLFKIPLMCDDHCRVFSSALHCTEWLIKILLHNFVFTFYPVLLFCQIFSLFFQLAPFCLLAPSIVLYLAASSIAPCCPNYRSIVLASSNRIQSWQSACSSTGSVCTVAVLKELLIDGNDLH